MVTEKSFIFNGVAGALRPLILQEDGKVAEVGGSALTIDEGKVWESVTGENYIGKTAAYDPVKKQLWVLSAEISDHSRLQVFEVKGRSLVKVTEQKTVPNYNSVAGIFWDADNQQLILACNNKSGYTSSCYSYKEDSGNITTGFSRPSNAFRDSLVACWWSKKFNALVVLCKTTSGYTHNLYMQLWRFDSSQPNPHSGSQQINSYSYSSLQYEWNDDDGELVISYTRFRGTSSVRYESSIRGIRVNDNLTFSLGTNIQLFDASGDSGTPAYSATVFYHRESKRWLTSNSHGSKAYTMDSDGDLNFVGNNPGVTNYNGIIYDAKVGSYLQWASTSWKKLSFDDTTGAFVEESDKLDVFQFQAFTDLQPIEIDGRNYYFMGSQNTLGKFGLFEPQGFNTNLNGRNFIGFSKEAMTDGQEGDVVFPFGTMHTVETDRNDLVPRTEYFIDYDGALINYDNGYGFAGTAISPSTLLIKG